ncbi:MAG: tautomerase family protein [Deltaproteobacteria bacterium]|nr:tautomerase family protein [Deltaproteobacteria bacterium]
MPHVSVKMYPGRTPEQKARLAEAMVRDLVEIVGAAEDSISVTIEDVAPEDWVEKVYKPDILPQGDKLFKKPGYDPL